MAVYLGENQVGIIKEMGKEWLTTGIAKNTEPNGNIVLSNTVTSIGNYAFGGKKNITSIIGPEVTNIGKYSFVNCSSLSNAVFQKVTRIEDDGFHDCTGLVTLDVRNVNSLVHRNFQNCSKLTTFVGGLTKLPSCGQDVFNGCSSLSILVLPALTGNSAARCFRAMTSLATIDLGLGFTGFTGNYNFQNSTSLTSIILRNPNQVVTISSTNEITGTPFANGGTGGTLYVPNNLISSYQSASNWSVILGYTNNQIKSIESTHTDPNTVIDLTLYYADGTAITS